MKAAVYDHYGPADVVHVAEVDRPAVGDNEVLVRVYAAAVSTADWRFRSSDFVRWYMWILGRAIVGFRAPRKPILGSDFAGRVVSVGANVTRFKLGDEVFGASSSGAHAEFVAMAEDGPIVHKPANVDYDEAAATPFGAQTALMFLRDFAALKAGQRVLVVGAAGGVGVFAVQIAKAMGAEVTAVASGAKHELLRALGADHVVDYKREDFTRNGLSYDIIFDAVGATSFAKVRNSLSPEGSFVPLEMGATEMVQAMFNGRRGGKKVVAAISAVRREDLETVAGMLQRGEIRAVIDSTFPLEDIVEAHRRVETRRKTGAVIVTMPNVATERAKIAA